MDYCKLLNELPKQADRSLFKVERWVTPEEGMCLHVLIQAHGIRSYLECGTANGYSALWAMAAMGDDGRVNTWDIVDRPKIWHHVDAFAAGGAKVVCNHGPFPGFIAGRLPDGPSLWFIDGNHSYQSVLHDWRAVRLLAEDGDVVVFHDLFGFPGIAKLHSELIGHFRGGVLYTRRGMGVIFPEQFRAQASAEGGAGEQVGDLSAMPIEGLGEPLVGGPETP